MVAGRKRQRVLIHPVHWSIALLVFLGGPHRVQTVAGDSPPTATDLVAACGESLSILGRATYRQESVKRYSGDWKGYFSAAVCDTISAEIRRDGSRVYVLSRKQRERRGEETKVEQLGTLISDAGPFPGRMLRYQRREREDVNSITISPTKWISYANVLSDSGAPKVTEGYVSGHPEKTWLPEVMLEDAQLTLRDQMEVVDGHPTYVVESISKYGKKTLWLDPEAGYTPRKIELLTQGEDLYYSETLNKPMKPLESRFTPLVPWFPVVEDLVTMESVEIGEIEGQYVLAGAEVTAKRIYQNGEYTQTTTTVERDNIDLDPDFESVSDAFTLDAPNGTRVVFVDDAAMQGLDWMWQDGRVVPNHSEEVIRQIETEASRILEAGEFEPAQAIERASTTSAKLGGIAASTPHSRAWVERFRWIGGLIVGGAALALLGRIVLTRRSLQNPIVRE